MEIYAIDFDGTLCENKYPEIGEPKQKIVDFCIRARKDGNKLILWTCRGGERLEEAIQWCQEHGIVFDAINANIPEEIDRWNNDPRKVGATWFIDDRNLSLKDIETLTTAEYTRDKVIEDTLSTFAT